jgi:hypothetical protein
MKLGNGAILFFLHEDIAKIWGIDFLKDYQNSNFCSKMLQFFREDARVAYNLLFLLGYSVICKGGRVS